MSALESGKSNDIPITLLDAARPKRQGWRVNGDIVIVKPALASSLICQLQGASTSTDSNEIIHNEISTQNLAFRPPKKFEVHPPRDASKKTGTCKRILQVPFLLACAQVSINGFWQ